MAKLEDMTVEIGVEFVSTVKGSTMLEAIKRLLGSSKAQVMAASLVGIVAAWFGIDSKELTPDQRLAVAAGAVGVAGWVVTQWLKAQGQADQGKEAAKIQTASPLTMLDTIKRPSESDTETQEIPVE